MPVGMNVSVNGSLSLCVSPVNFFFYFIDRDSEELTGKQRKTEEKTWQRAVGRTQAWGCCAHMLAQHSELNQRPVLWQTGSTAYLLSCPVVAGKDSNHLQAPVSHIYRFDM